jgi:hypothetical protein
MAGTHATRFIIEVKGRNEDGKAVWLRSGNPGLTGFFATREEANTALANGRPSDGLEYRVRQK